MVSSLTACSGSSTVASASDGGLDGTSGGDTGTSPDGGAVSCESLGVDNGACGECDPSNDAVRYSATHTTTCTCDLDAGPDTIGVPPADAGPLGPAGSACSTAPAFECLPSCCTCPNGHSFAVAMCLNGACADETSACRIVLETFVGDAGSGVSKICE